MLESRQIEVQIVHGQAVYQHQSMSRFSAAHEQRGHATHATRLSDFHARQILQECRKVSGLRALDVSARDKRHVGQRILGPLQHPAGGDDGVGQHGLRKCQGRDGQAGKHDFARKFHDQFNKSVLTAFPDSA